MRMPLRMCQLGSLVEARARCDNACERNKAEAMRQHDLHFVAEPRARLRLLCGVMWWILLTLALFDSTGKYIRTLGRKGLGPGEYKIAERAQIGKADSIVVLDAMQHRLSILSSSGAFVSAIEVPAYVRDVLPLGKGHFLINATKSGGLGLSVSR